VPISAGQIKSSVSNESAGCGDDIFPSNQDMEKQTSYYQQKDKIINYLCVKIHVG
jgi:hypothetical protein